MASRRRSVRLVNSVFSGKQLDTAAGEGRLNVKGEHYDNAMGSGNHHVCDSPVWSHASRTAQGLQPPTQGTVAEANAIAAAMDQADRVCGLPVRRRGVRSEQPTASALPQRWKHVG